MSLLSSADINATLCSFSCSHRYNRWAEGYTGNNAENTIGQISSELPCVSWEHAEPSNCWSEVHPGFCRVLACHTPEKIPRCKTQNFAFTHQQNEQVYKWLQTCKTLTNSGSREQTVHWFSVLSCNSLTYNPHNLLTATHLLSFSTSYSAFPISFFCCSCCRSFFSWSFSAWFFTFKVSSWVTCTYVWTEQMRWKGGYKQDWRKRITNRWIKVLYAACFNL